MLCEEFLKAGEYGGAGMFEEPERSLFYRKSLGIRRYYENCPTAEYGGEVLYPSGRLPVNTAIEPGYMCGMSITGNRKIADEKLAEVFYSEFSRYRSTVPPEHSVAGNMYTHSIPNYERILKEGFLSYIPRIEKIADKDMREGLLHVVRGIECYINRCVSYLESAGADSRLVDALKKVPMNPAENIYEAIVSWNFVFYLDGCDNLGCLASGLMPYYNGEDVIPIFENLFDNADKTGSYSMALGTDYNPLTIQCLEASKGKRRPMIELFVNKETPDEIWKKAFEVIRTSNGQPAFYNENGVIGGLKNRFGNITDDDLKKFCGGGCTEAMIAGCSGVGSLDAGINLLLILEDIIYKNLEKAGSFEEFYGIYIDAVAKVVDKITTEISNSRMNRAKYNPLPMRTLLIDDCIDKGLDYNNGGARYRWSIINFGGLINVIDSMLVIRDFVFVDKTYSPEAFIGFLKADDEEFLSRAIKHRSSYGNDNSDADRMAGRISEDVFSMLDDKKLYNGEGFIPASIQFMSQVANGKEIGATPDGRRSGAPLCDSLGAIFGKDTKGPTALLNSVTSLDLKRAVGIPVLNFNIASDFNDDILKGLILGYMDRGGMQMQISCVSHKTLLEAYDNPELHRNLVVRVGGYSEHFVRLNDDLKKMIINRTVQSGL